MTSFCANENSKLCNDCGHWAECPECGVCGLCRLYDPPSEQRTYCLKHYRQTFPGKGCDMCEMEARIEALEKEQSAWRKFTDEANRTLEAADKKIATLQARIEALEEALTPSAETKAAYWGEAGLTNDWTLIKAVMKAIRERALQEPTK